MAVHGKRPDVDISAGKKVLKEDLPRILELLGKSLEELGWRQLDDRTLLIPVTGEHGGVNESYLMKLTFLTGRDWPPSALFVNPETLSYDLAKDRHHLPVVSTPNFQVHPEYTSGDQSKRQLICCSATFEYYDVEHGGEDGVLWQPTYNFYHTLRAIETAMREGYSGRAAPNVG